MRFKMDLCVKSCSIDAEILVPNANSHHPGNLVMNCEYKVKETNVIVYLISFKMNPACKLMQQKANSTAQIVSSYPVIPELSTETVAPPTAMISFLG